MPSSFIHLHLHSAYSLSEGAIKTTDLIRLCQENQMPAVAVTDTNNMFGAMEFATESAKAGLQPILGAQVNVEGGHQIVLLVQTEEGYRNLCRLLSDAYMDLNSQGFDPLTLDDLSRHAEGLIALSGGPKGPVNQALLHSQDKEAEALVQGFKRIFGDRFYIELQRHGWPEEEQTEEALVNLAYKYDIPLVASNDCYFPDKKAYEAHDALLCISEGRYVTEEDRRRVTPEHYFKSAEEMAELFSDLPEAIQNTVVIAQRCSYLLEPVNPILPPYKTEGGRSELEELKVQAQEGLQWRVENFVIPCHPDQAKHVEKSSSSQAEPSTSDTSALFAQNDGIVKPYYDRLEYELSVIEKMGFPGYFLICSDFIRWAKDQNIPVGPGRGSGAGSIVAWALRITDLDPLEHGLLFERFLNPERISMPDFDIDFCQERRDEVIKYVQDKYGHDHVAQIITFGKLQARAVVRDVGRVLQLPYGQVDRIAKMIPNNPAHPVTLGEALEADEDLRAERDKDETQKKLIDIALQLEGLYRHASTHAAGVVIAERPLHELIPVYRDPRSDMPVTQFNMKYVEQAGLVKFDFLGLKTMTVIQRAIDMVNTERSQQNQPAIDILKIPLDDPKTYELIASGNTVGVFQLESAGMRDALRRIKPDRFADIIALVSLYRPGPMDNIPTYAKRKDGQEEPDYMHPLLKPILEDTYGIMIYQEQVLQAAQLLAGYTLGAADFLRKAMGKKIKEEMDAQREKFVSGAKDHNNVPEKKATEIFDQIAKFAGYGFNKAHATCYALIGYWTAWLKANHPLEFYAASMGLDLGNTDKLAVFKQDMDKLGFALLPPDINASEADFAVEFNGEGKAVRYALAALKGVGEQAMKVIVAERGKNGAYKSIEDFVSRLDPKAMNKRQFEQMICAGVFDSLHTSRADLYKSVEMLLRHAQSLAEEKESGQVSLFGVEEPGGGLGMPALVNVPPWDALEQLGREFAAVGFYLSAHPLDGKTEQLKNHGVTMIADLEQALEDKPALRIHMAGVLLKKQEKMSQKGSKYAFLQLSDPTGVYELMIFSDVLYAVRDILEPGQTLLLTVDAESKEDQVRLLGQDICPLDEALERKIRKIRIHVEGAMALPKLKEFLDIEGKGRAQIFLNAHIEDNQEVEIVLPGRWSLSPQARNILRTRPDVRAIDEL